MTAQQKDQIQALRFRGIGYGSISASLGIPEATIKTYCRRNSLQDKDIQVILSARQNFGPSAACKQCGEPLVQILKRKPKQFCSDKCRLTWWNAHRGEVNKKSPHKLVCTACNNEFESYDAGRKYCCHVCYIKSRFGGESNDARSISA